MLAIIEENAKRVTSKGFISMIELNFMQSCQKYIFAVILLLKG